MDVDFLRYLAASLTSIGMFGSALAIGNIFTKALESIARNPSAEPKLSTYVYVGAGMAEAVALFSLLLGLLIIFF